MTKRNKCIDAQRVEHNAPSIKEAGKVPQDKIGIRFNNELGGVHPNQDESLKQYMVLEIEPWNPDHFSRGIVLKEYGGDDTALFCQYYDIDTLDLDRFEVEDIVLTSLEKNGSVYSISKGIKLVNKLRWIHLK